MSKILTTPLRIIEYFLKGIFRIYTSGSLCKFIALPVALSLALTAGFTIFGFYMLPGISAEIGFEDSWISYLIQIAGAFMVPIIAIFSSLLFMLTIGSFSYDFLIERLMIDFANLKPTLLESSVRRQIQIGIIDTLFRTTIIIAGTLLVFIFSVPVLSSPLSFILSVFMFGYGIIDLPLSLTEITARRRLRIIFSYFWTTLCLGALMSLISTIPFAVFFALPAAYFAAVRIINSWELSS